MLRVFWLMKSEDACSEPLPLTFGMYQENETRPKPSVLVHSRDLDI